MKTIIQDTCDVVFKRRSDGKAMLTAEAQLASVSQTIQEEKIKGGIGNRDIAVLRSDKEVTLSVRSAMFDSEWLEMVSGTSYNEETHTIHQKEDGISVTKNASKFEAKIKGEPKSTGTVYVFNSKGEQLVLNATSITGGVIDVTELGVKEGDIVTVLYEQDATGQTLTIDTTAFPSKFMVEYHTIQYDADTNEVVNDLYWIFDGATPAGNFDYSFENGSAISPEIEFTAIAPLGSSTVGRVMEVPRA